MVAREQRYWTSYEAAINFKIRDDLDNLPAQLPCTVQAAEPEPLGQPDSKLHASSDFATKPYRRYLKTCFFTQVDGIT